MNHAAQVFSSVVSKKEPLVFIESDVTAVCVELKLHLKYISNMEQEPAQEHGSLSHHSSFELPRAGCPNGYRYNAQCCKPWPANQCVPVLL